VAIESSRARIPAFVNAHAGGVAAAREALLGDARFDSRDVPPDQLPDAIRAEMDAGTGRILVCGGDGTIATGAGAASGTPLEIALLPGGTLNHFARDAGLPLDPALALDVAATSPARPTDLGYVNGRVMLNTSAVGAYVDFVRQRDARKRWLGYHLASIVAAVAVWLRPRSVDVELRASDGTRRRYRTPLLFIGVGERVLGGGGLGERRPDGARALHVVVVNERRRPRIAALVFGALVRGLDDFIRTDAIDAHLVTEATVIMRHHRRTIAVDGEVVELDSPLSYELKKDAVNFVRP
jgi:diacylglycerol kinase family enzyme